jgi:tRNA-dihydrouridine synthase
MLGRAAYHDPWLLADVDARLFGAPDAVASREEAVEWATRVPAVPGSAIEVRRVAGSDEVPPGSARARSGG